MVVEVKVDPDKRFNDALRRAQNKVGDLTLPLNLITKSWFKGNRSIFDLGRKGPGKYIDLSPKYKARKKKILGSPYPILVGFTKSKRRSGKLARSMTNPTNPDSIANIINKKSLILGTKAKTQKGHLYPASLHYGTRFMPARPFVLLGSEQVAPSPVNRRKELWIKIIKDYVLSVSSFGDKK